MRDFKKYTSFVIRKRIEKLNLLNLLNQMRSNKSGQAFKVWVDRFDDVCLQRKYLVESKMDYIHLNPLQKKWNLVIRPEEYQFSSAGFYELGVQCRCVVTDYRTFFWPTGVWCQVERPDTHPRNLNYISTRSSVRFSNLTFIRRRLHTSIEWLWVTRWRSVCRFFQPSYWCQVVKPDRSKDLTPHSANITFPL